MQPQTQLLSWVLPQRVASSLMPGEGLDLPKDVQLVQSQRGTLCHHLLLTLRFSQRSPLSPAPNGPAQAQQVRGEWSSARHGCVHLLAVEFPHLVCWEDRGPCWVWSRWATNPRKGALGPPGR